MVAERYRALREDASTSCPPYPRQRFSGQGIVIPAGGPRYFPCAWVCINVLREVLGCTLPIEVWYIGPDDMSEEMIDLLRPLGVDCIDALEVGSLSRLPNGWELKPHAIIHSRFKDVLFLDADVVPVMDPAFLFSTPEYRSTGALFWPDTWGFPPDHPAWTMFDVPYSDEPAIDSGMMAIDKERSWPALHLVQHLNDHSEFYYRYMPGDAETFHFAWRALHMPHLVSPYPAENVSRPHAVRELRQPVVDVRAERDFEGRLLFQHRTGAKWIAGEENPRVPGFIHEEACLGFLQRLGECWQVRHPLPPIAHARPGGSVRATVIRTQRFLRCRPGMEPQLIELLSEGRIGQGRGRETCGWCLTEEGGQPRLVLEGIIRPDAFGVTCTLSLDADGIWRGRRFVHTGGTVELFPLGAPGNAPPETEAYLARLRERRQARARTDLADLWENPQYVPVDDAPYRGYEALWKTVRSARNDRDPVSLFFALKSLLASYGNDAGYVRRRLRAEFSSDIAPPELVDWALSGAPDPPPSLPTRGMLGRLRRRWAERAGAERSPER